MKVIVAIDDSPYSENVIDAVIKRPWPDDVEFKILTVIEPICLAAEDADWLDVLDDVYKRRREGANKLCQRAREKLAKATGETQVHFEVREGAPKSEIIDCAVEWNADRVLVGAHGHGICPHNILGGVSRAVATQAPCTVEIVRAPRAHAHGKGKAKQTDKVLP